MLPDVAVGPLTTRAASFEDIEPVACLFDRYRTFYGQRPDLDGARAFIEARFGQDDSMILIALSADGQAVGFAQLFYSLSSLSMARTMILNDLFVAEDHRRIGAAAKLLAVAREIAADVGAIRLSLSTAHDNEAARRTYEVAGWTLDRRFVTYETTV